MKIEQQLIEEVVRASDRIKGWLECKQHFVSVIEDVLMREVQFAWTGRELYIGASGGKEELETIFHVLAKNGFRLPEGTKRPKENQPDWSGRFVKCVDDPTEGLPKSYYYIFVAFTSLYCRREQVGVELREVPVFKIVCGDTPIEPTKDEIPF